MRSKDRELLDGINEMIEQAPSVGLCAFPFKIIRDAVADLITEKNALLEKNTPKPVLPYFGYEGKCPSCGVIFLDRSTMYCGNCGQALQWENPDENRPD